MIVLYMRGVYIPFPVGILYINKKVSTLNFFKCQEARQKRMHEYHSFRNIILPKLKLKLSKYDCIHILKVWIFLKWMIFMHSLLSCLLTFEKVQSRNLFILKINDICKSLIAVRKQSIYQWVLCHISVNSSTHVLFVGFV
jgi:hypothetical protein